MKRFLKRFLIFLPVLILGISAKPAYLLMGDKYQYMPKFNWVYTALKQSKKHKPEAKIVVLGDSVGNQLFKVGSPDNDGEIYSLTCSAAIDIVGQYILLYNFLEKNKPDAVVLVNNGYKYNLNAPQVFHHFLKTFNVPENQKHLTPLAKSRIKDVPFYFMSQVPHIFTTTWGPKIPFEPDRSGKLISDLSTEYLLKMEELCKEKGVNLLAIPPPLKAQKKPMFDKYMDQEIAERGLDYVFRFYPETITFAGAKKFKDMMHIKNNFIDDYIIQYRDLVKKYAYLEFG